MCKCTVEALSLFASHVPIAQLPPCERYVHYDLSGIRLAVTDGRSSVVILLV